MHAGEGRRDRRCAAAGRDPHRIGRAVRAGQERGAEPGAGEDLGGPGAGRSARAEELLGVMDDVYDLLVSIDFPDGITGGLRRTTDQLRAVLERTRNDLTLTLTQERLQAALRDAERTFLDGPKS